MRREGKKNRMKLSFALVLLFAAATLAEECQVRFYALPSNLVGFDFRMIFCQIYRGAVEKLAVEIASRQVNQH